MEPLLFAAGANVDGSAPPAQKRTRRYSPAEKRLRKELKILPLLGDANILGAFPCKDNILLWRAYIHGPEGSIYSGLRFELGFEFTESYPFEIPKVVFITQCYHPNVLLNPGEICVDIFEKGWSPSMNIESILRSLISLLNEPNPDSALNGEAAGYFSAKGKLTSKKEYQKKILGAYKQNLELDRKFQG